MGKDIPAGIRIISDIVDKLVNETKIHKIVSGIQQLVNFWNYMPDELKRKAFFIFEKIWVKKYLIFSTHEKFPEVFLKNDYFKDAQLKKIWKNVSKRDAAAFLLGLIMREEISRGQHEESEKIKQSAYTKYSNRGLTITNFVTTNDVSLLCDEIGEIKEGNRIKSMFEFWIDNYPKISILLPPEEVKHPDSIKEKIKKATKSLRKSYVIVNMCSNDTVAIDELISIIEKMPEEKVIKYKNLVKDTGESGFYFYFKGIIYFR